MTDAPQGLRLTIVGCSGSFPSPASPASCYLVEAGDEAGRTWRVLLDLGNGALGQFQRYAAVTELDALLLSHLHPDHFIDALSLYVARRYDPAGAPAEPLPVHGPPGTLKRLQDAYGADADGIAETFDVTEWADGEPVRIGPLTVTAREVAHPVTAYGLRVEHAGRVLAYSGDTDACPPLEELARDADVFLVEASFVEGRDHTRGVHLTGRRAGETAAAAGAGRVLLTHIPVWTDRGTVLAEARGAFAGPVEAVEAGARYEV